MCMCIICTVHESRKQDRFPPLSQAVTNFVTYKFGQLPQNEWQMMYDLAKMFLYCFNHWKLETPSVHARSSPTDDNKAYKENYARYGTTC